MPLPQVQSKSGKMYDADSPQGKMIVNAPTQPFSKESSALGAGDQGGSSILESILAVVSESAGYLKAMAPYQSEIRGESIEDANVAPDPNDGRDDAPAAKGPGFLSKMKSKFSMGGLLKTGIIAAMAALMAFSDKFAKALEPVLKWIKEDLWPAAIEGAKWAFDKITSAFNSIKAAFKFLTDPETSLEEKVAGVKKAFKDFGVWLLGLFDNLATKIATAFGMKFEEGETLGSWIGDKVKDGFAGIKTWFEGVAPDWFKDGVKGVGGWVLGKITGVFGVFKTWFGEAKAAWDEDGAAGVWSWAKAKVLGVFKPFTDWFGEAKDKWDEGGALGVFTWIVKEVGRAFKGIVTWFTESAAGQWIADKVTGIWGWIKGKVADAWTGITTWFSEAGTWVIEGVTGIWGWITGKVNDVWTGIKDWFTGVGTWLVDGATGIWDWITGKVSAVWDIIKGWFTFKKKEDEKLLDEEGNEISMGALAKSAAGAIWAWLKSKFTFDASKLKEDLFDFGTFIKALSLAVPAALAAVVKQKWTGIGPAEAFNNKFDEVMLSGGLVRNSTIQSTPSGTTSQLGAETAAFRLATAGAGMGAQYIDAANNAITTVSQDTYTAQDLDTDDTSFWGKALSIINPFD
jgi:hypothetical protein